MKKLLKTLDTIFMPKKKNSVLRKERLRQQQDEYVEKINKRFPHHARIK